MTHHNGPLDGIKVIDLGQLIAGPMVATILGDFGATVVKVENPKAPDPLRRLFRKGDFGVWSKSSDRNKLPVTLNLKAARGRDLLLQLLAEADVMVENFTPGTLEKLNLDPEWLLREVNPGLVIVRVSGWGQTGPMKDYRGYGRTGEAASGFAHLNGDPAGPPSHSAASLGDTAAAVWSALGVLLALRARDADGHGQVVDMGMSEGLLRMLEQQLPVFDQLGIELKRAGNENPGNPTVNVYETADGHYISVSAATPRTQQALIDLVGLDENPELNSIDKVARHREKFHAHVTAWVRARTADEVEDLINASGAAGTRILGSRDIAHHPHLIARNMVLEVEDADLGIMRIAGIVPRLNRTPGNVRHTGRQPGSANLEVFGPTGLGLSRSEIDTLREDGVI